MQVFLNGDQFFRTPYPHPGNWAEHVKGSKNLDWPKPTNSMDIQAFLGLVWYIAVFLLTLANYTHILTPVMTKDTKTNFKWTKVHQGTFDCTKLLVVSSDCLTVIDHLDAKNKIFITCNTSDWCTAACLSFGNFWETTHPVGYDSVQLNGVEKSYLIHEKEPLAIICALKK